MRLALVGIAFLATAASEGSCGSPASSSSDPCAGKICGDACRACPPDDPSCVETADIKACSGEGLCVTEGTFKCDAPGDCSGKACGAPCVYEPPCRLSDPPCMMPSSAGLCGADGQCWPESTPPDCAAPPPSWGCTGKACGDYCNPCAPGTACLAVMSACDAQGQCAPDGSFTCP